MPIRFQIKPGSDCSFRQEEGTGLVIQNPDSAGSSPEFTANNDRFYGLLQAWGLLASTSTNQTVTLDLATLDHNYRICRVETIVHNKRTGGTPDHKLTVQEGDAVHGFADLVAEVDLDGDTIGLPTNRTLDLGATLVEIGSNIRVILVVGGATGGTAAVQVMVYAVPISTIPE